MSTESTLNYLYGKHSDILTGNPLGIQRSDLEKLQLANADKNTRQIFQETSRILKLTPDLFGRDVLMPPIMRDIGIFMGSCIKAGINISELNQLPELDNLCQRAVKQGRSPFHTVYEYSVINPPENLRTFTGGEPEKSFIKATVNGVNSMVDCISKIEKIRNNETTDPENIMLADDATQAFKDSGHAVANVIKEVGGEYFAKNLRPYFDSFCFNNNNYDAPGGSQMPMVYLDYLLFGSDLNNPIMDVHTKRNIVYLPTNLQQKIKNMTGSPSIITQMENTGVGIRGIADIIASIYGFRIAHLKLAQQSFGVREQGSVGSGGADPTLLSSITDITYEQLQRAKKILKRS